MRAKKARTEIRQEQIARAAMKLLATQGWQRVSLAAIARQVGVVTSAVYRHFRSKDQVLDAVLDLVEQSLQANVAFAPDAAPNPIVRLHDTLIRHVELITGGIPVPRIVLSEAVFTGSPRHRKRVHKIYRNYLGALTAWFRAGQEHGSVKRNLKAEELSLMWLGLVQAPAILWLLGRGDFDLKQQCESAWNIFLAAIQTQRPAAAKPAC